MVLTTKTINHKETKKKQKRRKQKEKRKNIGRQINKTRQVGLEWDLA